MGERLRGLGQRYLDPRQGGGADAAADHRQDAGEFPSRRAHQPRSAQCPHHPYAAQPGRHLLLVLSRSSSPASSPTATSSASSAATTAPIEALMARWRRCCLRASCLRFVTRTSSPMSRAPARRHRRPLRPRLGRGVPALPRDAAPGAHLERRPGAPEDLSELGRPRRPCGDAGTAARGAGRRRRRGGSGAAPLRRVLRGGS